MTKKIILFAHIPKTAGSSLRAIGMKNCERSLTLHVAHDQSGQGISEQIKQFNQLQAESPIDGQTIVLGHFGFSMHEYLGQSDFQYITMLRDPVDRVVSHFYHLKSTAHPGVSGLSLIEFARSNKFEVILDNMQTRFLSNYGWRCYNPYYWPLFEFSTRNPKKITACDDDMFLCAKNNLLNNTLFGLQEEMADSLSLFSNRLGWEANEVRLNQRKVNSDEKPALMSEAISIIRAKNKYDLSLYELAQKTFRNQV
ncbi:sulfotransferase family 2 domain-containing protein [Paraglaciecola sp. 25GB23A]|uniref:sulfotransferase family 2 domain-containing protein n=1 Tax=Paraglaciecola sp. 25GB23A TaxID=3156068 RepID=UPI0032AEABFB